MTYLIALLDHDGRSIADDDADTLMDAKKRAKHILSDEYARLCESTHEQWDTRKVEIRDDRGECVWDRFHPGSDDRTEPQILRAVGRGIPLEEFGTTGLIDYVMGGRQPAFRDLGCRRREERAAAVIRERLGECGESLFRRAVNIEGKKRRGAMA